MCEFEVHAMFVWREKDVRLIRVENQQILTLNVENGELRRKS